MTSPVFGSSATTDPRLPVSASSATFCTRTSIPRIKSSPATGGCVVSSGVYSPCFSTGRPAAFTRISLEPALAVKLTLVRRLDSELADETGAGVLVGVDLLHVLFVDGAHVADGVNRRFAERVVPGQPRANVDARELVPMDREQRHFLFVQLQLDRHALVDLVQQDVAPRIGDLLAAQQSDLDQQGQRGVERLVVPHLFAHQFDLIRRQVVRQHHAVPIQDQAAAGRYGLGADAVALRQSGVIVVLQDLQVEQTAGHRQEQDTGDDAGHDAADREQAILGKVILYPRLAISYHGGERSLALPATCCV